MEMGIRLFCSILLLTFFFLFKSLISQQPNTDGYFVSEFFKKMGLNSFHDYNFSGEPPCSWKWVLCDSNEEHIIELFASNLGLFGPIPDTTIGKLTKLQSLDLSNNNITDLPSDFWSLGSLKNLNLSSNQITGPLHGDIGNFGLLESFDISRNNFSGIIPLGLLNCKSLVLIDLSSNRLNGSLPNGFGAAFFKLKSLNLSRNEIYGRDLDFSGLTEITSLNISGNFFKGSVMGVFKEHLEVIDLSRNQFQGHISQVRFNSSYNESSLVYLDLSENQLSGKFFHFVNQTQNLKHLNLAYNRFSRQEFLNIEPILGLEYLNLSRTSLINHIPAEISQLSNLMTLDLSWNHLSGQIPFLSAEKLKILDLSNNNLSGKIPETLLDKLPYMKTFNFSYNNLSFCTPKKIPLETLQSSFSGSTKICPIAANPRLLKRRSSKTRALKLAIALALSMICLLVGILLFLAFGCKRKTRKWVVKQTSYREEQSISGPFSFQTDSTTWVADIKQATSVLVVIFDKPLLNITFSDLLSATSNFDRGTLLAEGKFGPVYRGFLPGGIHVAVKVLIRGSTLNDQEAAREFEYLGRIKHPNLVPLMGYCLAGDQRIAIYDYMENGNLQNLLHDLPLGIQKPEDWSTDTWEEDENVNGIENVGSEGLLSSWKFSHKILLGIARALAFLHHGCIPPIIHRDVKASSVYLDDNLEPRLSDFGLAKVFGNGLDEDILHSSPGYMPPEFSQPGNDFPTPKSDVYCFGVVLFELISGKKPVGDNYHEEKEENLVSWVRALVRRNEGLRAIDPKIRFKGPEDQMEEALKIGYLCTADLPSKRPSMQQIVGLLKDIDQTDHS